MEIVIAQTEYSEFENEDNVLNEAVTYDDENLIEVLNKYLDSQEDVEVYDKKHNCAATSEGVLSAYYSNQLNKVENN